MKLLIFAFFLTMTTSLFSQTLPPIETGVSQSLAKWRAAHYSDVRYKLNITLEKGAPLMKGEIEIRVKLTDAGAKNDLILDWRTTQFVNDKDKPFADVVAVNDATEILTSQPNEHIRIPQGLLKTGENYIKINFASPIKTSGAAITRYVDKEDGAEYIYSLFVPSDASTAFPVFDQPDLKAIFSLVVDAPKGWKVISNSKTDGLVYSSQSNVDGYKFLSAGHIFDETKPISTYVFAFAAGEFEKLHGGHFGENETFDPPKTFSSYHPPHPKHLLVYVRKSQAEKFKPHAEEVFRLNREGVKFLESYFDYKFPFPKYDLVLIPEFPFGGMEHAGATFLRESSVIFPTEPTKNDYVSRANVIFHEAAHQWFGDTVTMKWFDDLWLKEGFAEFMAYKTLEKVMPEYNAWKIFYERNKQAAYLTDSTRGTTPIYQEIPNLSAAKSAYGNIVYRKAPSFLKQAEFYLGEKEFQTAVRSFLKKHKFANAEWTYLVKEFETASGRDLKDWANVWVKQPGLGKLSLYAQRIWLGSGPDVFFNYSLLQATPVNGRKQQPSRFWEQKVKFLAIDKDDKRIIFDFDFGGNLIVKPKTIYVNGDRNPDGSLSAGVLMDVDNVFSKLIEPMNAVRKTDALTNELQSKFIFPNYQDYGYGIFLLDERSRAYVLANIQTEKDDFLRAMMWGSLWDSVREAELAPQDYVALVIKNLHVETDESTIQTLLGRVSTAMNYYLSDKQREEFAPQVEQILLREMIGAKTVGKKITFYRAFLNAASSKNVQDWLKRLLASDGKPIDMSAGMDVVGDVPPFVPPPLKTKDKFDIVTRLLILEDRKRKILGKTDAEELLAELEKNETSDEAKRYAYAAKAGIATVENKAKFWTDFIANKEISESWIEAAFSPFNSVRHAELTLPYLEKALAELPNLKRNRKIFFVNGWLAAFIGGQKSEEALKIVNKFLAANPNLDRDLRLKILENADALERAVKIRAKYGKN